MQGQQEGLIRVTVNNATQRAVTAGAGQLSHKEFRPDRSAGILPQPRPARNPSFRFRPAPDTRRLLPSYNRQRRYLHREASILPVTRVDHRDGHPPTKPLNGPPTADAKPESGHAVVVTARLTDDEHRLPAPVPE